MTITGADVLAERKRRKMSRKAFAELTGLTESKISNIERGRAMRAVELQLLEPHVPEGAAPETPPPSNGDVPAPTADAFSLVYDDDPDVPTLYVSADDLPPQAPSEAVTKQQMSPSISPVAPPATPTVVPETITSSGPVGVAALYEDGRRLHSNSELQTFKHCRRRWWLGWYRGLRLKKEKLTGAMPIGSRVHVALNGYYVPNGQVPTEPSIVLEAVIAQDEARLIAQLSEQSADTASSVMISFKKEADLARAMIEGYMQWLGETGADQGYRVIGSEQRLSMDIPLPGDNPAIRLTGILDLRLEREHDGARLFLDHKTTSSFDDLIAMLRFDEQMPTYWLLEQANRPEGEPPVAGALYNMLRKVKRTATANSPFYQRVEVQHNPIALANFRERLVGEALTIHHVERCLEHEVPHQQVVYPTPSGRCMWGCEFKAVCPMFDDGSRAEDFIAEHYVQINPMDRYDEEKDKTLTT